MFSKSLLRRIARAFSNLTEEVRGYDIFYQLTYMSATAAAGISRDRVFELAQSLPVLPSRYFSEISALVSNLRYSYFDACRIVGERVKSDDMRAFLLRLSDALRSGEPLAAFLTQEAQVQGENYANEYERNLESLKRWTDGYTAVTVSVSLIVIINMVSSMIYPVAPTTMVGMVLIAATAGFSVAWVLSRAAPHEIKNGPLIEGTKEQRLALKLFRILFPGACIAVLVLAVLDVSWGWIMITVALIWIPIGAVSLAFDRVTTRKDKESSAFFRSLGGNATSRRTTLTDALSNMQLDPFPALQSDIRALTLRLEAVGNPEISWRVFARQTGSHLINQVTEIFYEATNLGGDPERAGVLSSLFAMRTTMLRAKRAGVAATFTWLLVVMHTVLVALMVFLLEVIRRFTLVLQEIVGPLEQSDQTVASMRMDIMALSVPDIPFLEAVMTGMIVILAFTNAYAIIASEGTHLLKIFFYLSILLLLSGVAFLIVPYTVHLVM